MTPIACPFCGGQALPAQACQNCGRNTAATRRPCARCRKLTPSAEQLCMHCGARFKSEMRWKIPLIVALFILAFILSIIAVALR